MGVFPVRQIRDLKIQGASNIAIFALETLLKEGKKLRLKDPSKFHERILKLATQLAVARPTEPATRNALALVLTRLEKVKKLSVSSLKRELRTSVNEVKKLIEDIQQKTVEVASNRIPRECTILTHCHSSTVVRAILKAHGKGKEIEVICTETRPKYQGRITARELASAGVDTTLIVDSAVRRFMKEVDLVMVGADVICSNGAVVNKIGTSTIAAIAKEHRVPLVVVSGSYKFDPLTEAGHLESIEERNPREILPTPIKGVKVRNPAFDVTPPDYIDGIASDGGLVPPIELRNVFKKKFEINMKFLEEFHKILKSKFKS